MIVTVFSANVNAGPGVKSSSSLFLSMAAISIRFNDCFLSFEKKKEGD